MDREYALDAARSVAAVAAAHADETEQGRRLAPAVVAALDASGLNRLMAPTALGGSASAPMTLVEVVEEIARADASTAWCAGIGMGSNFMSGLITEGAAAEIFTDLSSGGAGPFAPGGRAVATPDGFHVSGRWPYASNCHQAKVAASGIMEFVDGKPLVDLDGPPEVRLGFLTRDQFEIDETWNTVGMRGTGSHDIVATDIEVPRERTCSLLDPMWPNDAVFRLRTLDVLGACLSSVALGIGRAALDAVAAKAVADAAGPPAFGPRPRLVDDPLAQLELARAETRLRGTRAVMLESLAAAYDFALAGDTPPRVVTAVIGLANCDAFRAAEQAVSTAVALLGSAAVRDGGPLQRLRADLDTASTHVLFAPSVAASLARELAGIPTSAFPYLPPPS